MIKFIQSNPHFKYVKTFCIIIIENNTGQQTKSQVTKENLALKAKISACSFSSAQFRIVSIPLLSRVSFILFCEIKQTFSG